MEERIKGFRLLRGLGLVGFIISMMMLLENYTQFKAINYIILGFWIVLSILLMVIPSAILKKYKDNPQEFKATGNKNAKKKTTMKRKK